jgi:hypothetical protein
MSAALWSGAVAAVLSVMPGSTPHLVSEILAHRTTPYATVPSHLKDRVGSGVLNVAAAIP